MNSDTVELLKIINTQEEALSLKAIETKTAYFGLKEKKLLRALSELKKVNRVKMFGQASSSSYWQKDVREAYAKNCRMIFVHKGESIAGYLFQNIESFIFCYTDEYLIENSTGIATLKFDIYPIVSKELPAVFDENIPEGINRELLEVFIKSANKLDILVQLTHNIGDIHFSATGMLQTTSPTQKISFLSNIDTILGDKIPFPSILDYKLDIKDKSLFPEGEDLSNYDKSELSGISGFQYKRVVDMDSEEKSIHQNDGIRDYILKPYSKIKANADNEYYFPHIALNEHLFMSFAKNELGFRVPQSHLIKREHDEEYHYLVKRFDRLGTYRFAKTNFSTYLGLRAANKYDTTSEKMFKRIKKELVSENERMELLKHYFYSMVISYEDMHTKNLSLIIDGNIHLMAPLYDIATTLIYSTTKHYDSYLTINGQHTNITPRHFNVLVDILDISKSEFKKEAALIVQTYRDKLPLYIEAVRNLGEIKMWTMKQKSRIGQAPKWVKNKEISFADALALAYDSRIETLTKLKWIV
ncbi:MAG: type II toxin-antitoxin system HipA family toxin [Epsilonproteobacteria bacterium]|nr:MAG: type II toxin-antitoxin system HipA family toxin [Campylobacterota bacterium]